MRARANPELTTVDGDSDCKGPGFYKKWANIMINGLHLVKARGVY
jgi:hypothetical protein